MNQEQHKNGLKLFPDAIFTLALVLTLGCVFLLDQPTPDRVNETTVNGTGSMLDASVDTDDRDVPRIENDPGVSEGAPQVSDVPAASVSELPATGKVASRRAPPVLARLEVDVDALLRQQREREMRKKAELNLPATVQFFATETQAESVVFVVDCSGSMEGSRIQRTRAELAQSILALKHRQRFFVCFFNSAPIAMFQHSSRGMLGFLEKFRGRETALTSLVEDSGSMKLGVFKWMNSIAANGGTNPESSLLLAAAMDPDVVYLLSDGGFAPLAESTFAALEQNDIVVHTLAFEDRSGAAQLTSIAKRTGGTYRFIPAEEPLPDVELTFYSQLTSILIDELTDRDDNVQQQAQRGLVEISGGKNFGPERGASADKVAAAVTLWIRWWADEFLVKELQYGSVDRLFEEMVSTEPIRRLAAVLACGQRKLFAPEQLIPILKDSEPEVRKSAHKVLVALADGRDYGPADTATNTEVAEAITNWSDWAMYVKLVPEFLLLSVPRLRLELQSPEPANQRAAANVLSKTKVTRHDRDAIAIVLINSLSSGNDEVRQEIRRTLVHLADGADFGPLSDATNDECVAAAMQWSEWRLEKLDEAAAGKFGLAKTLYDTGKKKAAYDWLKEIVRDFPGTATAEKAELFLKRLDETP